jgi:large subunit ribosomal protein L35
MPKLKTHKGAQKRFRVTKGGVLLRSHGLKGHLKVKKSSKRKRALRQPDVVSRADAKQVRRQAPYLHP